MSTTWTRVNDLSTLNDAPPETVVRADWHGEGKPLSTWRRLWVTDTPLLQVLAFIGKPIFIRTEETCPTDTPATSPSS
jgi:hypothetical protein